MLSARMIAKVAGSAALVSLLSIAVAPRAEAGTLVVANKSEATVSLVDLDTTTVRATLPTGQGPHEVAVSPDGRWAVVTDYGGREAPGSTLTLIEIPTTEVAKTIALDGYSRPHGAQWLADGRRIVVTAEDQKALLVVDTDSGKIEAAISTGQAVSHMVAVTPDGELAFVANIGSGTVSVLDLETGKHVKDITTGEGAEGVDVTPSGSEVWVTNRADDTVSVIDRESLEIVATLTSEGFPIRIKITPDGRWALVSNARTSHLTVYDVAARKPHGTVDLPLETKDLEGRLFSDRFGDSSVPIGVVVEPAGKIAYVAHANADAVSIVDLKTWKRVGTLTAGREPDGMAYSPVTVPVQEFVDVDASQETEATREKKEPGR